MAYFQGHLIAGIVSGGTIDIVRKVRDNKPLELSDLLILGTDLCLGAMGGILPDKLEPAIHPRHRKFFHSILFIGIIVICLIVVWQLQEIPEWVKWLGTVFALAFVVHLLIDGFTPAGLPIA